MNAREVVAEVRKLADPVRARFVSPYIGVVKGGYGEGDLVRGLSVPQSRTIAKKAAELPLAEIRKLLRSPWHEERLIALVILVERARKADDKTRDLIVRFYLSNLDHVNNWDLVDMSAAQLIGPWIEHRSKALLTKLAKSKDVWRRRVAIITTFHLIRKGEFKETIHLARLLTHDRHDLMHKAVGWMLREVGKMDPAVLRGFLAKHADELPRTSLRYAIEKFSPAERRRWLNVGRIG